MIKLNTLSMSLLMISAMAVSQLAIAGGGAHGPVVDGKIADCDGVSGNVVHATIYSVAAPGDPVITELFLNLSDGRYLETTLGIGSLTDFTGEFGETNAFIGTNQDDVKQAKDDIVISNFQGEYEIKGTAVLEFNSDKTPIQIEGRFNCK